MEIMSVQQIEETDEMIILTFTIKDQVFGVDIFDIINVTRVKTKTLYMIPKASKEVLGMYNNTDEVFPVFDLHLLLGHFGFNFEKLNQEWISVIKIQVKGFTSGLGIQDEPNFITIGKKSVKPSKKKGIKSKWKSDDQEIFILDLEGLFPNVKQTQQAQDSDIKNEDDLDLSQYLLEE